MWTRGWQSLGTKWGGLAWVFAVCLVVAPAYAAPVTDPASGHTYELINDEITWEEARIAAQNMSTATLSCHLATITSAAENAFVLGLLPPGGMDESVGDVWIGGQQSTHLDCVGEGNNDPSFWGKWVTGELWSYTNWQADAPDDCGDLCLMYGEEQQPRAWDEENCDDLLTYLVECEPPRNAPVLSYSALVLLASLLPISGWWILRRNRARQTVHVRERTAYPVDQRARGNLP